MSDPLGFLSSETRAALELLIEQRVEEAMERRLAAERRRPSSASPYMTVEEAAAFLRCGRGTIDNLLSAGRVDRRKRGRRTLVLRAEIEALVVTERERRATR